MMPEGLRCEVLGGETDCQSLYYEDELIFSRTGHYWLMLSNAVISDNKKWLLLKFQNTFDTPTVIYLVDLEG